MKNLILVGFLCLSSLGLKAQEGLTAGTEIGIPVGSQKDLFTFNMALKVEYIFYLSNSFKLGPTIGYDYWLGKDFTDDQFGLTFRAKNLQFLPLAVALKFMPSERFYLGGDLGYAISFTDNVDGGLFLEPRLAYNREYFEIYGFYKMLNLKVGNVQSVGLGFVYHY